MQDHPEGRMEYRTTRIYLVTEAALLAIILIMGSWFRFQSVTQQGICPGDGVKYTQEALRWASGQPPTFLQQKFYRPAAYFLQGAGLRLFGINDYAIKLIHGIMDLVSILLLYRIVRRLTRSPWPGLAACLVYASLPAVISLSRMELLHTESTFLTLWAVLFLVVFITRSARSTSGKPASYSWLAGAGFFLGLSANTHADLAFLAPGIVVYLFISAFQPITAAWRVKRFLMTTAVFSAAFFTPYLIGMVLFGFRKVWTVFITETFQFNALMDTTYPNVSKPVLVYNLTRYTLKYYFGSQSLIAGLLALGSTGIMIQRRLTKVPNPAGSYLPFCLLFTYVTVYTFFFRSFEPRFGRIMLPLLPLFLTFVFQWYYLFLRDLRSMTLKRRQQGRLVFIGLAILWWGFLPNAATEPQVEKTEYRYVYDLLKTRVDSRNKLLITPVAIVPYSRGFRCDLYFGRNAVYLNQLPLAGEYTLAALRDLLKKQSIRFVWVGNNADPSIQDPSVRIPENYKRWLRNEKYPYSVEKDIAIVYRYIMERRGVLIDRSKLGKLYWLTDTYLSVNDTIP